MSGHGGTGFVDELETGVTSSRVSCGSVLHLEGVWRCSASKSSQGLKSWYLVRGTVCRPEETKRSEGSEP